VLVAKNPVIAARFFNVYMKAFISALLGYDPDQKDLEGGILGVVKAYYGCVEAQGRGTLHCHMVIWLEGGLNPDEIKRRALSSDASDIDFCKRLLAFLDDTMSNEIPAEQPAVEVPSNKHHPCSVRGVPIADIPRVEKNDDDSLNRNGISPDRLQDLHNLVLQCQSLRAMIIPRHVLNTGEDHPSQNLAALTSTRIIIVQKAPLIPKPESSA
jgi:hypothetical protein